MLTIIVSIDSNLVSVLTYYSINNSVKKKMKLKHEYYSIIIIQNNTNYLINSAQIQRKTFRKWCTVVYNISKSKCAQ